MSNTGKRQLRRLLALFGLAAALGSPAPGAATATVDAERAALDARVLGVREALQRAAAGTLDGGSGAEKDPTDAMAQWFNWPNWNNWNNWPNWGKWFNSR